MEIIQLFPLEGNRLDENTILFTPEINAIEAAKRGLSLVLRSYRLTDQVLFDVDGIKGQTPLGNHFTLQGIEGIEQTDGK